MTKRLTPEQLIQKFDELKASESPEIIQAMAQAAAEVEGVGKKYCTPGQSPYEGYIFPTKQEYAKRHDHTYTGAPYSYDDDPDRLMEHMREQISNVVLSEGNQIRGIVYVQGSAPGEPYEYALWVHTGTYGMRPRPFIVDAIRANEKKTLMTLSKGVEAHLRRVCES